MRLGQLVDPVKSWWRKQERKKKGRYGFVVAAALLLVLGALGSMRGADTVEADVSADSNSSSRLPDVGRWTVSDTAYKLAVVDRGVTGLTEATIDRYDRVLKASAACFSEDYDRVADVAVAASRDGGSSALAILEAALVAGGCG